MRCEKEGWDVGFKAKIETSAVAKKRRGWRVGGGQVGAKKMPKIMHNREWWRETEVKERQVRHSKRGGVTPDIKRVMPKNVRNERDKRQRNRKKEKHRANSTLAMPDLSPYWAKSSLVGRTSWLCTRLVCNLSKRNNAVLHLFMCRKMEPLRGQYLDLCRSVCMLPLDHIKLLYSTHPQPS